MCFHRRALFWCAILATATTGCATPNHDPQTVAIGTFNIEWLGDGIEPEQKPRTESDYAAIARIIEQSGADVMAVQEIENDSALGRLLHYLPSWHGLLGKHGRRQNVGVLYRSTVFCTASGDYLPLAVDTARNRAGFIVHCRKGNFDWLMMVVHLKSTSRYDSTEQLRDLSIQQRRQQAQILATWIDSVLAAGSERDILVVGDFNDFPKRSQRPTLQALDGDTNVVFLTEGLFSCLDHRRKAIDHILASRQAALRWLPERRRMIDHRAMLPDKQADRISDHCPVVGEFEVDSPDTD